MKRSLLLSTLAIAVGSSMSFSQSQQQNQTIKVGKPTSFRITKPLREITPTPMIKMPGEVGGPAKQYCEEEPMHDAIHLGRDPVLQDEFGSRAPANLAEVANFDGPDENDAGIYPPDPDGCIGPNHYIIMCNYSFAIYDKNGNLLFGPSGMDAIFQFNSFDCVVMYDKYADRWFMSQINNLYQIEIAISQTNDPMGSWYTWLYPASSFPGPIDYPKFGIWQDGYYMCRNYIDYFEVVFERDELLAGNPNAQVVSLNIPDPPSYFSNIQCPLPAWTDGDNLPPAGTPGYFFHLYNNSFGSNPNDHIRIYEVSIDWANLSNSTITVGDTINVAPFDGQTNWTSYDVDQPNTFSKVPSFSLFHMNRAQYRRWGSYNTVVLNHSVDVDGDYNNGNNHFGIRWYELRQDENTGDWSLYQQGTYAPDSDHRWLPGISMDKYGNIAMAYNVSSSTTYPSIHYTGRYANDPLGQMTVAEKILVTGNSSNLVGRWGDYPQMTVDPTDDATFWYSGQYHENGIWKSRVGAFHFDPFIGIDEQQEVVTNLNAYYNEQTKQIIIRVKEGSGTFDVSVYDILGRQVVSNSNLAIPANTPYDIDASNLATGTYIVKVDNQNWVNSTKLVIR